MWIQALLWKSCWNKFPTLEKPSTKSVLMLLGGHYNFFLISHPNTNHLEVHVDLIFLGPRKCSIQSSWSFACPNQLYCQRFLDRLRDGDNSLEADLLTACESRSEEWHPRDNSCNSTDIKVTVISHQSIILAQSMETNAWPVTLIRVKHHCPLAWSFSCPSLNLGILNILNEVLPGKGGAGGLTATAVELKQAQTFVVVFLCWCGGVFVLVWWCFCGGVFVVVFLSLCLCGGAFVVVFLWLCFCGGVFVVVFLCWCFCAGVFVVVFLWWCFCGGVCVVWLRWCSCGGVLVAVFLWWSSCGGVQSTTPVLQSTTPYYKVLLQYYSVLQSTTPVLLRTTKYYKVLLRTTKYYSVLQSTTPVLQSITPYYKVLLQYYKVLLRTTK